MKKKISYLILFALLLVPAAYQTALAQEGDGLSLRLRKDFGYSSGMGTIQGTFSMRAEGPEDLARVVFLIDGKEMGTITQAPFRLQFNTGSYPLGIHMLQAVGYTSDGRELRSAELRTNFVSSQAAGQSTLKIILPVLALVLGSVALSFLFPMLTGRGRKENIPLGAPRRYGVAGGAICPRCGRPFSRNFLSPNLLLGKLERCPHCGKLSIVAAASPAALRAAEQAELENAQEQAPAESEEERLRKELERSRYHDL